VLQLQQTPEGEADYAEFLHLPRRKFTDFSQFHLYNIVMTFIFKDIY
jgi:hypothetical protein